jgi:hypothetical protein
MIRSLYLGDVEESAVRRLMVDNGLAFNTVVRVAIRKLAGLPLPAWAEEIETTSERVNAR